MTQTKTPWFVAQKRARKADQIARHLARTGRSADDAAHMSTEERRVVETSAGITRPGSDRTWRDVVAMLAGSRAPGARCLTCGLGDPDGIDAPPQPFGHAGPCSK